jgi:hypothetical protein
MGIIYGKKGKGKNRDGKKEGRGRMAGGRKYRWEERRKWASGGGGELGKQRWEEGIGNRKQERRRYKNRSVEEGRT